MKSNLNQTFTVRTGFFCKNLIRLAMIFCSISFTFAQGEGDGGVPEVHVSQAARHSSGYTGNQGTFSLLNYNIASIPASEMRALGIDRHVEPGRDVPKAMDVIMNNHEWVGVFFQEDWYKHGERVRDNINTNVYPYKGENNVSINLPDLSSLLSGGGYPTIFKGDGLYRFARRPFYQLNRFKFGDCKDDDCLGKKGFTLAVHEVAPGVFVHIYNIHAESGQDNRSEKIRKAGFEKLRDAINTYSLNYPVIVIGDFNARYARGVNDGLLDFVNQPFVGRNRVMKDVFYDIQDWRYDRFKNNSEAKVNGEGVEKCFFMNSEKVELIPTLYKDERARFGGKPANEGGDGYSDHPPFTITFSYAINPNCYDLTSDDFDSSWGNWEKTNGTEKVERQDGALVIRNNNSGSLIRTKKRWGLTNSQSFYLEYEYKTNGSWDNSDYFDVKYSTDGGNTYKLLERVQGSKSSYTKRSSPTSTDISLDMRFLIESEANKNDEKVYFTSIKIKGCGMSSAQSVSRNFSLSPVEEFIPDFTAEEPELLVYPNPATDIVNIGTKDNQNAMSWKILDLMGKEVLSGQEVKEIDVSTLKTGVYILRFEVPGQGIQSERLFIN